ncbi:zinc-finger associated domain containing protein, partial [Oryctes borbonicus]
VEQYAISFICLLDFYCVYVIILKNMDIKSESDQFNINKICRACLTEKDEMRSIFLNEESIGQAMQLADMIMGFTTVQIQNNDGLPGLICVQCTHEVIRAFSFKQLCEQSDTNLRQYLGKPLLTKTKEDENHTTDYYTNSLLLDNFGLDDSSNDSDDSYKEDFGILEAPFDPNDEKAIAQRQLLKAAKLEKCKLSKKKLLTKNGKVDAERSFSKYKNISSARRTQFSETNPETYLMLQTFQQSFYICAVQ